MEARLLRMRIQVQGRRPQEGLQADQRVSRKPRKPPSPEGSFFGPDNIPYFNGGLFSDNRTIPLDHADLGILNSAAQHDWSHIEPVIFGTLFERSLDSAKRSKIGAHYTSPEDILLLIEPVVIDPLKRRWELVRPTVLAAFAEETAGSSPSSQAVILTHNASQIAILTRNPSHAVILTRNPSHAVILTRNEVESQNLGRSLGSTTNVAPVNQPNATLAANAVPVIEPSPTLAANAVPVIEPSPTLAANAVPGNELSAEGAPIYQPGPEAQVQSPRKVRGLKARHIIATTPPNLRRPQPSLLANRAALTLLQNWAAELTQVRILDPACGSGNFLVYWFEKAQDQLELNQVNRVGLLATQGIRGGANRKVLERIQRTGTIFWAWSDRPWLLAGATVHVSMIAFERSLTTSEEATNPATTPHPPPANADRTFERNLTTTAQPKTQAPTARHIPAWAEGPGRVPNEDQGLKARHINPSANDPLPCLLNGQPVPFINPDLTTGSNTASAQRLKEN